MENALITLLTVLGGALGGGGIVKLAELWSRRKDKAAGAEAKVRRDDRTYIHDGYRELYEKANHRCEILERRLTEQDLKIEEVRGDMINLFREKLELQSEASRLRDKIARLDPSKLGEES